jgi:hypothetical protein
MLEKSFTRLPWLPDSIGLTDTCYVTYNGRAESCETIKNTQRCLPICGQHPLIGLKRSKVTGMVSTASVSTSNTDFASGWFRKVKPRQVLTRCLSSVNLTTLKSLTTLKYI